MQYTISAESDHLRVRITGAPSKPEVMALLADMLAASREARLSGSLVEVQVAYGLNLVDTKDTVIALRALGFPPDYRIAVYLVDEIARRAATFAEDVAVNRGLAVRVFNDRDLALAWLRS